MKHMDEAKKKYMNISIPGELSQRVLQEVEKANKRRKPPTPLWKKITRRSLTAAAVLTVTFTIGLNTSVSFAKAAEDLPVIGQLAKVLTFRSYEKETKDLKISVDIPSINTISEDFHGLEETVNAEILELCETYADAALKRAEEYRQAFMDTGGTVEEWEAHKIEIKVWYEVKSQTGKYLSLAIMGTENWNSAYSKTKYYNFDLENGTLITLRDVLGEDYAKLAKEQILSQIKERETEDDTQFFEEQLPKITEETAFYMNTANVPVVVFEKYEIAQGALGSPEFEITP